MSRRKSPPQPASQPNPSAGTGRLVFTLLVLAGFGYFLFYLSGLNPETPATLPEIKKQEGIHTPQMLKQTPDTKNSEPVKKWTFHDELSNRKVEVDDAPAQSEPLKDHVMQCASFRSQEQAETLKAKIAFTGLVAQIKTSQSNGSTWYKVVLGPYKGKRAAERDRHLLQSNQIEGCRIW